MTAGLFKHWFPGILSLIFLAGNSLPGQSPILDLSEIATAFKTTAKSALTAQAMLQSHHPTLTWDGTHRMAGGLRYTLASRLQSDAVLPGNQQVWVGETSYLVTTNLGISGQLGWIRNGTDAAYIQGAGMALKLGTRGTVALQLSALKGAKQFYNRAFDLHFGMSLVNRLPAVTLGIGLNRTTYVFHTGVLPQAPRSMETHLNYVYGSWNLKYGRVSILPVISAGPKLVLFSLELLKLSP